MTNFDVIVSMDWLASCYALIYCHAKMVKFSFMGEDRVIIKGEIGLPMGKFISYLKAKTLIGTRCLSYLDHVHTSRAYSLILESITVMREFLKVFLEDSGLLLVREI